MSSFPALYIRLRSVVRGFTILILVVAVSVGLISCGDDGGRTTTAGDSSAVGSDSQKRVWPAYDAREYADGRALSVLRKAEKLRQDGRRERALNLTREAIEIAPGLPNSYFLRARIQARLGSTRRAIRSYDSVLVRDSAYPGAWQNRGNLLFEAGDLDEALQSYRRSFRHEPRSDVMYLLGRAHARLRQPDSARQAYRRALQIDSTNHLAWYWLSRLQVELGEPDEAITSARRALRLDSDNPRTRFVLGRSLLRKGRAEKAVAHLQAAVAGRPNDAEIRTVLAQALRRLGRREEARHHRHRAAELRRQAGQ